MDCDVSCGVACARAPHCAAVTDSRASSATQSPAERATLPRRHTRARAHLAYMITVPGLISVAHNNTVAPCCQRFHFPVPFRAHQVHQLHPQVYFSMKYVCRPSHLRGRAGGA